MEYGVDDELSIGLLAFNEAINTYDINKGKFLSFARLVISNRLIDYFRKQSKFSSALISYDNGEDNTTSGLIDKKSVELFAYDSEAEDRKYEIIEYTRELGQWGISFNELVRICPRQDNLRNEYIRIAILISRDKTLLDELYRTKRLPIKMLEKKLTIHRKKIERGRIYIIALVVAIVKKYSFLDMTTRNI